MLPLLVEIGTEELPPAFLRPAALELAERIRVELTGHGIATSPGQPLYTPRRLAVLFPDVAPERPARTAEVQGPPRKAAFDSSGKPTRTAIGFAQAHDRKPEDIFVRKTERGEYAFVQKRLPALPTADLLKQTLPGIIGAIPFPKTMRWLEDKTRFARPVRWLLCLLGSESVEIEYAGLRSGSRTFGHRDYAADPLKVPEPAQYLKLLAKHKVIAQPDDRRNQVLDAVKKLSDQAGGEPVLDPELVEETVNTTEYPVPILCNLDSDHLSLPALVLITALKKHQRCFAIQEDSRLLPYFIAVADNPGCDQKAVVRWYERAVESRLKDARFFFDADLKEGLEPLVEESKQVTWIEGIGSYFDKTEHLQALCRYLATQVPGANAPTLNRAALLAKADLLTNMVREKEFTSLQGQVGGIYARLLGEPDAVADAIAEHYRPVSADDELPATIEGALLSIADRMVNIVGTFLAGAKPTGSEDPFALRRQASGMLSAILHHGLDVNLSNLLSFLGDRLPYFGAHQLELEVFFQERVAAMLADRGIPYDIAEAVLGVTLDHPTRAMAAAKALLEFRNRPEFKRLIIGQKRVANILKDQRIAGQPNPETFAEKAEKQLWAEAKKVEPDINRAMERFDFVPALELLLTLRQPIDRLFDEVLVMAEDEGLRTNRLRLMLYVRSLFRKVADLSKVVLETAAAPA